MNELRDLDELKAKVENLEKQVRQLLLKSTAPHIDDEARAAIVDLEKKMAKIEKEI